MITLPQLITTDTDMTAGLTSGKTTGSAEDFLALLAGALGADGAQGKDARITLADLQAAGGKLSKELLTQHGEPGQALKLADLLAQKANATDETLTDLTQAQHLLSTLTPSLKTSALAALSKTAQHDEKTPALSDEDLASLSAFNASAINLSPLGQWRVSALASVEDASPALRDTAASEVPRFLSPAIISAGCQSDCIML